jgi:hypothetical protein
MERGFLELTKVLTFNLIKGKTIRSKQAFKRNREKFAQNKGRKNAMGKLKNRINP